MRKLKLYTYQAYLKSILAWFFLLNVVTVFSQQSWIIGLPGQSISASYVARIDSVNFWVIQHLRSGQPFTDNNILHVTVFDECGYREAFEITGPQIFNFRSVLHSWVDEDTLRIALTVDPHQIHSHTVPAVLAVHRENYGTQMTYQVADNVNYLLSFKPLGNDRFFTYHFLSYTDRPTQYACYITDKYLNIEKAFTNFNEYTITGGASPVSDGFVLATSKYLVKLDQEMKHSWGKYLPADFFMGQFQATDDGFIAVLRDRQRFHMALVKFSNSGELLWVTDNLLPAGASYLRNASLIHEPTNVQVAVYFNDPSIPDGNFLQVYQFDSNTGEMIDISRSPPLPNTLVLQQMVKDDFGNVFLLSNTGLDLSGLININNSEDCNIGEGGITSPMPDIIFESYQNDFFTNNDYLWNGTTTLITSSASSDVGDICNVEESGDWLPDTDTLCNGASILFDLSAIRYPILWDDGIRDKIRTIDRAGTYGFKIDHCQIDHHETMDIIEGSCGKVFLPNIFTPNGDGLNDEWTISHSPDVTIEKVHIYDRWGALIFECDSNCSWDGRFKNQMMNSGVFVVVVDYVDLNGSGMANGNISLIR